MSIDIKNFYEVMPKKYHTSKTKYANYDKIRIEIPTRMLLVGASGSGKTNTLMNLLQGINCFNKIWLIAKNLEEPLYKFLQDVISDVEAAAKVQILTVGNSIEDIPDVDEFNPKNNNLLIIDDMISEKESKLQNISAIWIRGRKQNLTSIFISQSYFKVPQMIRQNTDYLILKKIASKKDLKRIVAEYALDKTPEEMLEMYQKATQSGSITDFFMIDLAANDNYKYRKNYDPL